jgi:hypothetical protein
MELALLLWPAQLVSDRAYAQILPASFSDPGAWASLIAVVGILAAVVLRRRKDAVLFWAAGFFVLTLLPASNLLIAINATMAERFLYLPAVGFAVALAALGYRFAPRHAAIVLAIATALFAGRTLARNRDWDNELSLMSHDVKVAPLSFRVHDTYGQFLYAADPKNLDLATAELEKAWEILSPLPPDRNTLRVPGALATYYVLKGDSFPAGSSEGQAWYLKALPVLVRADEIARVGEKVFDDAQAAHGKPVAPRRSTQMLYLLIGNANAAVGNIPKSLEAFRYGRGIEPSFLPLYDRDAAVRRSSGDLAGAARVELLKSLALGMTPPLIADVERAYASLPGGACAVTQTSGVPLINLECPPVREDLCPVLEEAAAERNDARKSESPSLSRMSLQYGCATGH